MLRKKAFTLIELLVVISIIALLISILMPALNKAREQATGSVCLGNQKTLVLAWIMYADESDGRLCYGSVHEYVGNTGTYVFRKKYAWLRPPLLSMDVSDCATYAATTQEDRERGIQIGTLYKYTNTVEVYHCPGDKRDVKNEPPRDIYRSYSIPHGLAGAFTSSHVKLSTIKRPSDKYVFVEEWQDGMTHAYNSSAWALKFWQNIEWQDPVAIWHNKRSTLSFGDGHAEMHGWLDERTIDYSSGIGSSIQRDNPDIEYMVRGFAHLDVPWGSRGGWGEIREY